MRGFVCEPGRFLRAERVVEWVGRGVCLARLWSEFLVLGCPSSTFFLSFAKFENFGSPNSNFTIYFSADRKCGKRSGSTCQTWYRPRRSNAGSLTEVPKAKILSSSTVNFALKMGRTFVTDRTRSRRDPPAPRPLISPTLAAHSFSLCATQLLPKRSTRLSYGKGSRFARSCRQGTRRTRASSIALPSHRRSPTRTTREPNALARDLELTLNPAPVRAQQVRGQTPKVAKQDKKKVPKGRAGKRIKVSVASSRHARVPASSSPRKKLDAFVWFSCRNLAPGGSATGPPEPHGSGQSTRERV